jgi:hypothetical protein
MIQTAFIFFIVFNISWLVMVTANYAGLEPALAFTCLSAVLSIAAAVHIGSTRKELLKSVVGAALAAIFTTGVILTRPLNRIIEQTFEKKFEPQIADSVSRNTFERMLQANPDFRPLIWPPPASSAFAGIPSQLFAQGSTLADVALDFEEALARVGYSRLAYFYVPYGFAIVTGIEQIKDDGSPLDSARRWFAEPAIEFSLAGYLRLLLAAPIGRYRAIVFVLTTEYYNPSQFRITRDDLALVSKGGAQRLPGLYRYVMFRPPYRVEALIYEFQGRAGSEPVLVNPSAISGSDTDSSKVREPFYKLALSLSIFYLFVLLATILSEPIFLYVRQGTKVAAIDLLQVSNLWLGPLQGIVVAALGVLFFLKDEDRKTEAGGGNLSGQAANASTPAERDQPDADRRKPTA